LDYQTMVRHLSTNTADAYGLDARGRLAPGHAADICILSPSGMAENATDDAPTAPSSGVRAVLVNGTPTFGDWTTDAQPSPGAVISH
jgi:N-acyl-D-amino-acid deacylase